MDHSLSATQSDQSENSQKSDYEEELRIDRGWAFDQVVASTGREQVLPPPTRRESPPLVPFHLDEDPYLHSFRLLCLPPVQFLYLAEIGTFSLA